MPNDKTCAGCCRQECICDAVFEAERLRHLLSQLEIASPGYITAAEQRGYERGRKEEFDRGYEHGVAFMREQLEIGQQRRDITDETRGYCADLLGCELSDINLIRPDRDECVRGRVVTMRATIDGAQWQEIKTIGEDVLEGDDLAEEAFFAMVYRDLAHRIKKARDAHPESSTYTVTSDARPVWHKPWDDSKPTYGPPLPGVTVTSLTPPPGPPVYMVAIEGSTLRLPGDPHGPRLSPADHSAQLRAKLAASEVLHGPFVHCQNEDD